LHALWSHVPAWAPISDGPARSGIGLAIAASRTGSAASTFLLPIIVAYYGVRTSLAACVGVLALGGLICLRWAPETRGVRLGALDQAASRRSGDTT